MLGGDSYPFTYFKEAIRYMYWTFPLAYKEAELNQVRKRYKKQCPNVRLDIDGKLYTVH
jgi:hypothetical protein